MPALRVLFDTNVYDAILAAGDEERIAALVTAGKISIVTTQVQEDEIRQIRNRTKQAKLLALLVQLGGERVEPVSVIAADTTYMSRDEILARVAETCCDLLVTDDRELADASQRAVGYRAFLARVADI